MKQISDFRKRAMRKNRKGGIEGLPLQLMIVIIIASLGLAMMVGWMGNIEGPKAIGDIEVSAVNEPYGNIKLTVSVYDIEGNPVEGADVVITGMGAKMASVSDPVEEKHSQSEPGEEPVKDNGGSKNWFSGFRWADRGAEASERSGAVPHGVTDSDGVVVLTVNLNTTMTHGYLGLEVSKSGYSGNSTQVMVTI